jgi:hypothetical protein
VKVKFTAKTKSVKADLAKGTISISFEIDLTDGTTKEASELAFYTDRDSGLVDLLITPRQQHMFTEEE